MGDTIYNKEGTVHEVYSIKDELTGRFMEPVYCENDQDATRWFKYILNKNPMWKSNAAMYSLYHMSTFNDKEGFKDYNDPEMICGGVSVLDQED